MKNAFYGRAAETDVGAWAEVIRLILHSFQMDLFVFNNKLSPLSKTDFQKPKVLNIALKKL